MTSFASKTEKAMATIAAIESTIIAPAFGLRSPSMEIDESTTGELVGFVAVGLGAMDTLTGTGVDSVGLARTTGGLFGLLSAEPSGKGVVVDESSGSEVSADFTFSASGAGVLLTDPPVMGVDPSVSDSILF
jgi:hypothetical protein